MTLLFSAGTVTATDNSPNITFVGSGIVPAHAKHGDEIRIAGGYSGFIDDIDYSAQTAVISPAFTGTGGSSKQFSIRRATAISVSTSEALTQVYNLLDNINAFDAKGTAFFYLFGQGAALTRYATPNNASPALTTQLVMSAADAKDMNVGPIIQSWRTKTLIMIRAVESAAYSAFLMTSLPVLANGLLTFNVQYVSHSGTITPNAAVVVGFVPGVDYDALDAAVDATAADVVTTSGGVAAATTAKNAAVEAQTAAETARGLAVTANTNAQTALSGANTAKTGADTASAAAVVARTGSETAKTAAEAAQSGAVTARTGAETALASAVTARTGSETALAGAVTARTGAETAQTGAVTAKVASETARDAAVTARAGAETARTGSETALAASVVARDAAAASATDADFSEAAAVTARTGAETAQTGAVAAQAAAAGSATSASTSAAGAVTAQNAAAGSATSASTANTNAQTAKTAAETAQVAAETAETNAETAQVAAETAQTGAVAAKASAETARDAAAGSASTADTARIAAEAARDSAENVSPDNYLLKSSNGSDIPDKPAFLANVGALPLTGGTITGELTVQVAAGGQYSKIWMRDDESTNGKKGLHANTDRIGFLGGADNWLLYANAVGQLWSQTYGWLHDFFMPKTGGTLTGKMVISTATTTAADGYSPQLELHAPSTTGDATVAVGFHIAGNYARKIHMRADGYIGVTGWQWYVDTSGNMVASGNISAYSDERLKENIRPIDSALDKLMQLDGVMFEWNGKTTLVGKPKGTTDIGVIAQQVERVFPEIVIDSISDSEHDHQVWKTVDYARLVPVLIEAIKELRAEVNELRGL